MSEVNMHEADQSSVASTASDAKLPQKKFYRQRAHCNPLADHTFNHPTTPDDVDWTQYFPENNLANGAQVEFADIGCGYGGLIVNLSPLFPDKLMVGFEIRLKVSDYVNDKIKALRVQHPGQYGNLAVVQSNTMKYLPCYFRKGQMSKMFILFPDPHVKKSKNKWRIVSPQLCAEYAYFLRETGRMYIITDVHDLFLWMTKCFDEHPLFRRLSYEEMDADICTEQIHITTEEGKKVARNSGDKFAAVYERIPSP